MFKSGERIKGRDLRSEELAGLLAPPEQKRFSDRLVAKKIRCPEEVSVNVEEVRNKVRSAEGLIRQLFRARQVKVTR